MTDAAIQPQPAVSVLVAVRDGADTVGTALESALGQTLGDLEAIVVDDASRDATPAVAREAAARDGRVRVLSLDRNVGPAAARNRALAAARGRFVAVLDADDAFAPTRLERLLAHADQTGADIVSDDLLVRDGESGAVIGAMFGADPLPERLDAAAFVRADLPCPDAPRRGAGFLKPMIARGFLERTGLRWPETMRFAEDYAFALSCLMAGARWATLPEPLYSYAVHGASLTARHDARDLAALRRADEAALASPAAQADRALGAALAAHLAAARRRASWSRFVEAWKAGDLREAARAATADRFAPGHVLAGCLGHLRARGLPRPPGARGAAREASS